MQHDLWPLFLLSNDTPPVKALMKPVGLSLSLLTFAEVIGGKIGAKAISDLKMTSLRDTSVNLSSSSV